MRTDITNISIPTPCQQAWNKMIPSADGRFCESCAKTVIDFSTMTADQIIAYMAISSSGCGRFGDGQLDNINARLTAEPAAAQGLFKRFVLTLSLLTATQQLVNAQTGNELICAEQTADRPVARKVIATRSDTAEIKVVSGRVLDGIAKFPLPGATIYVNDKAMVATNAKGEFQLNVPIQVQKINVKILGYQTIDVAIKGDVAEQLADILLKESTTYLGGYVVVTRPPLHKRLFYRFIKRPIKRIFG